MMQNSNMIKYLVLISKFVYQENKAKQHFQLVKTHTILIQISECYMHENYWETTDPKPSTSVPGRAWWRWGYMRAWICSRHCRH